MNLLKSKFFLGVLVVVGLVVAGSTASAAYMHTTLLKMGQSSSQVMSLQQTLNGGGFLVSTTGAGSPGMESMYFGAKTKAAVMAFQAAKGLSVDGVVGAQSGAALAAMTGGSVTFPAGCTSTTGFSTTTGMPCTSTGSTSYPAGCTSAVGFSPTTGASCAGTTGGSTSNGPLKGSVGTIDYTLTSGYSNEEVGEADEDVKVAGLELDLEDSDSDVEITAVKLNFDVGTAGNDFEDYADEVSVWLGSEEVARVDGDTFNDDNDFEKTISLSGAIVRMGDVDDLYVAVSGVSNLDTADISDTWTVDFASVRFEDAEGVVTTEDPTEAAVTFSFESFATSTDVELKISEGDEDINDAHVINVDATDDTDNVEVLSFNMEAEGDSDLLIDALPVTITTVETTGNDPDDLISTYYLFAGDEEIGTENNDAADVTDDSTTVVVFNDLDYTLDAGDEVEFTVKVKLYSIADALDAGDTIQATFGETETDLATFEVEDESGEELVDADKTGTVAADTHEVRDIGIMVTLVSTDADVTSTSDGTAGVSDSGTFMLTFDVKAFDGPAFIDLTAPDTSGGATESDLASTGTGTLTAVIDCAACTQGTDGFEVEEDQTERFTITTNILATASGFFDVELDNLLYALTDVDGNVSYTFNLDEFKTDSIFLRDF